MLLLARVFILLGGNLRVGEPQGMSQTATSPEAIERSNLAWDRAWGSTNADRPLTMLWHTARWDTVTDDDLVFLLPRLTDWQNRQPGAERSSRGGPCNYLTRSLRARAVRAAALMAHRSPATARLSVGRSLSLLLSTGIVTGLSARDFRRLDFDLDQDISGQLPSSALWSVSEALPDWLAIELTALAHLDRMLADANSINLACTPRGLRLVDWPVLLADVLIRTIASRLNGAYVYAEFAFAHELLSVAAVVGHLVNGRAVCLPTDLARSLIDILSVERAAARYAYFPILDAHANLIGGTGYLIALARRAVAEGYPCLIEPRAAVTPNDFGRRTWNEPFLRRIGDRQFFGQLE
jgi:hypothetical protein